uniref:hypothetical protein n=1 Tax=Mesorhizobium sp. M2D.F.Ca.ET.225.01.1.1 TaxID=2563942 RepID=UPI001677DA68
ARRAGALATGWAGGVGSDATWAGAGAPSETGTNLLRVGVNNGRVKVSAKAVLSAAAGRPVAPACASRMVRCADGAVGEMSTGVS